MSRFPKRAITAGIAAATVAASGLVLTAADGSAAANPTLRGPGIGAHQAAVPGHLSPQQNSLAMNGGIGMKGGCPFTG
ncbi:MAG: hypothetical protein ACR2KL_05655 [Nocardioidaceae bacterium]